MIWVGLIITAYLIGSIPFGLLIGLACGIDVRKHGSGNIGATNVGRVVGRKWGHLCLAADLFKGLVPTVIAGAFVGSVPTPLILLAWLSVGMAAVLGHVYPVYLNFRGGKGVSTTIGVALGIYPFYTIAMLAALIGYASARFTTGWVSLGSIVLAIVFPAAVFAIVEFREMRWADAWPLHTVAIALGLLIVFRHRSNIGRMMRGTEPRAARG